MPNKQNSNQLIKNYWDCFFTDKFTEAEAIADELISEENCTYNLELKSRILLKEGLFDDALENLRTVKDYSGLKLFLEFLTTGDISKVEGKFQDDIDSRIYHAQTEIISRIYCGTEPKNGNDPDNILEGVFKELIDKEEYDRAVIAYSQSIELLFREQELGRDIILPIAFEQIDNLLALAKKAKYDTTKGKVFLLKAKLFKDTEAAEDAQILFGKDGNQNGLGEVYTFLAVDMKEEQYFEQAIESFKKAKNFNSLGFVYEALASLSLVKGGIQDANKFFLEADKVSVSSGYFEKLGLTMQKMSLLAVKGEFNRLIDDIEKLINTNIPKLFKAQAYQILASCFLHSEEELGRAEGYITKAADLFSQLKRYNQLINAKNVHFQILSMQNDLDAIIKLGEDIIQIANRLDRPNEKASKYIDIAFSIVRINAENETLDKDKIDTAADYFKKAIKIHKEEDNYVGEADVYQAMGNMFANVGKFNESLQCLMKAKKIYKEEGAILQSSICATLVGLLVGDSSVLSQETYKLASENYESALDYFLAENLLDLIWKTEFYLADLNERLFTKTKEKQYKDKTKEYYLDMHEAASAYEKNVDESHINIGPTTIEEAFTRAQEFFDEIGEDELGDRFER